MRGARGGLVLLALGALAGCGVEGAAGPEGITLPATEQRVAVAPPSARLAEGALVPRTPELAIQAPRAIDPGEFAWLVLANELGQRAENGARWRQTGGPEVTIHDADGAVAWFQAPNTTEEVELRFEVDVALGDGLLGTGEVSLILHDDDASIGGGASGGGGSDTGPPEPPAPVTDLVLIVADKDLDERFELYATGLDGSEPTRLNDTLAPRADVQANFRISPNGRYVAFTTRESGVVEPRFFVARTDGSSVVEVAPPDTAIQFFPNAPWAPDSSRVAFAGRDGRLYTVGASGVGVVQVSEDPVPGGFVSNAKWAPTSRFLAYVADHNVDNVRELFLAHPRRRRVSRLSAPMPRGGDVVDFAWSPVGDRVAYWADQATDNFFQVFAARVNGSPLLTLSPLPANDGVDTRLLWAPDGSRLLYSARQVGVSSEFFTTRSDGTGNARIAVASGSAGFGAAVWTPGSDAIVYVRGTFSDQELFVTGPEGQATRRLYAAPPRRDVPAQSSALERWRPRRARGLRRGGRDAAHRRRSGRRRDGRRHGDAHRSSEVASRGLASVLRGAFRPERRPGRTPDLPPRGRRAPGGLGPPGEPLSLLLHGDWRQPGLPGAHAHGLPRRPANARHHAGCGRPGDGHLGLHDRRLEHPVVQRALRRYGGDVRRTHTRKPPRLSAHVRTRRSRAWGSRAERADRLHAGFGSRGRTRTGTPEGSGF